MNHIHKLQCDVVQLNDEISRRSDRIQEFREHLASSKFAAIQADGSRGDWIATEDVRRWLSYIEDIGQYHL